MKKLLTLVCTLLFTVSASAQTSLVKAGFDTFSLSPTGYHSGIVLVEDDPNGNFNLVNGFTDVGYENNSALFLTSDVENGTYIGGLTTTEEYIISRFYTDIEIPSSAEWLHIAFQLAVNSEDSPNFSLSIVSPEDQVNLDPNSEMVGNGTIYSLNQITNNYLSFYGDKVSISELAGSSIRLVFTYYVNNSNADGFVFDNLSVISFDDLEENLTWNSQTDIGLSHEIPSPQVAVDLLYHAIAVGAEQSLTFLIEPGTYHGQLFFDGYFLGYNDTNSVRFLGGSDPEDVVLASNETMILGGEFPFSGTITITFAGNLTFENLTVDNRNSFNAKKMAVQTLLAKNITFEKCFFYGLDLENMMEENISPFDAVIGINNLGSEFLAKNTPQTFSFSEYLNENKSQFAQKLSKIREDEETIPSSPFRINNSFISGGINGIVDLSFFSLMVLGDELGDQIFATQLILSHSIIEQFGLSGVFTIVSHNNEITNNIIQSSYGGNGIIAFYVLESMIISNNQIHNSVSSAILVSEFGYQVLNFMAKQMEEENYKPGLLITNNSIISGANTETNFISNSTYLVSIASGTNAEVIHNTIIDLRITEVTEKKMENGLATTLFIDDIDDYILLLNNLIHASENVSLAVGYVELLQIGYNHFYNPITSNYYFGEAYLTDSEFEEGNFEAVDKWGPNTYSEVSFNDLGNWDASLYGMSIGDEALEGIALTEIPGYLSHLDTDIIGNPRNMVHPYKGAYEASLALPVEWISLNAFFDQGAVIIEWTTGSELNNYGFEIQKSADKKSWKTVGSVQGIGTTTQSTNYRFVDDLHTVDYYRIKQIDITGAYKFSSVMEVKNPLKEFMIFGNYPNPFNPTTKIKFNLPESGDVNILVYNMLGQEVQKVFVGKLEAGVKTLDFNATGLSSGVYFYSIQTETARLTQKMILAK